MTPDQYRREGAEAMREAALYQCVRVPAELPNSPRMAFDLGLHSCESAIRAIDVDAVLAGLGPAPDAGARLTKAGNDLSPWISASMSDPYAPACEEYLNVAEAFLTALAAMEADDDLR